MAERGEKLEDGRIKKMTRPHFSVALFFYSFQVLIVSVLFPSLVNCESWTGFEPQFVPMDRNVTGPLGGTTFLTCRIQHLADRTVSWVRQSDLHILTSGLLAYTSDSRFRAHHSPTSNDWILEIRDLKWTDAGVYECQVPSSDHKQQSHSVTLAIIDAEPVILEGAQVMVEEGSDIRLSCSLNYQPSGNPVILWKKDTSLLNYDPRVNVRTERVSGDSSVLSHVVIKEARAGDGGNYSCHAPTLSAPPARTTLHVLRSNSGMISPNSYSKLLPAFYLLISQDLTRRYTVINIIIFFLLFHSFPLYLLPLSVQLLKTFRDVT